MKVPFVSFLPMEKELDKDLRAAFERVYTRSWYIGGVEDEEFEKAFCTVLYHRILCRCLEMDLMRLCLH